MHIMLDFLISKSNMLPIIDTICLFLNHLDKNYVPEGKGTAEGLMRVR